MKLDFISNLAYAGEGAVLQQNCFSKQTKWCKYYYDVQLFSTQGSYGENLHPNNPPTTSLLLLDDDFDRVSHLRFNTAMKLSIEDTNIVNGAYVRHVDVLDGTHLKLGTELTLSGGTGCSFLEANLVPDGDISKYHSLMSLDLTEDCNFWSSHALRLRTATDYDNIYGTEVNPIGITNISINGSTNLLTYGKHPAKWILETSHSAQILLIRHTSVCQLTPPKSNPMTMIWALLFHGP